MKSKAMRELMNVPVRVGLKAQGHIPTIEAMLYAGMTWREIGDRIGWCHKTAKEHYEWHLSAQAQKGKG